MGLFTDNVISKSGQSAKNGPYFLQSQNFATTATSVPSNSLASNMIPYVSRLVGFIHNLWDPFVNRTVHNNLLQSGSKVSGQNFDDNYGSLIDSVLPSHWFSNQNANFDFLKTLESENLSEIKMNSLISSLSKRSGISVPNMLNFVHSSFANIMFEENINNMSTYSVKRIFNPDMTQMQVIENNLALFKELHFETKDMCDNDNNFKVATLLNNNNNITKENKHILSNCTEMLQIVANKNSDTKVVSKPTSVQKVIIEAHGSTLPKKMDKSIDTLNQELMSRKNKKMTKHSKKKRRRQKKKAQAVKNSNLTSELNDKINKAMGDKKFNCSNKYNEVDDFNVIFEERLLCDNLITTTCKVKENVSMNSALSFIFCQASNSESDSDFDSDCDNVTTENIFEEDFGGGLNSLCIMQSNIVIGNVTSIDDMAELCTELKGINIKWQNATVNVSSEPKIPSKVTFAPEEQLLHICPIETYDRKGEWEIYALERCRFKRRIEEVGRVLSPCLSEAHRTKIRSLLQSHCD